MPSNLTDQKIKDTYRQLLHVNDGVTSTEKTVYSGLGVALPMKVGSLSVSLGNVQFSGNTLTATNTNGGITLTTNGTGKVNIAAVNITGGDITGITPLAVAYGGTGAATPAAARAALGISEAGSTALAVSLNLSDLSDVAAARTNLGLVIGTNVQAYSANLDGWAAESVSDYMTAAEIAAAYQAVSTNLTTWAAVTRAAAFDTFVAAPTSDNLRTLVGDETGAGSLVFATAPTIDAATLTGAVTVSGLTASRLVTTNGSQGLDSTITSANLAASVSDETGTGSLVFATSPTLVTPALGTPSSVVLTNATGLPIATGVSGLAAGIATFLATPTSANLIAAVTNETGTGSLVFATSPSLTTPTIAGATLSGSLAGTPTVASAWTWSAGQLFPTVDIGNADTTLSRSAASVLAVEGKNVVTNGSNSSLATSTSTVGSVPAWADYEGGGYATINISAPLMFSSKYGRGASATDAVDTRFVRWANYTGGTPYTTNSNLAVSTMAGAGGLTFEWAGLFTLDSYRTAADNTQDVGIYIQSIKNSTGGVWCLATELQDKGGANPTVGTVNVELAGSSTGADNNNQRLFLHIIPSSRDASMTEWGRGIVFSTGALAKIKSAVYFDGTNYDYILDYSLFQVSGAGNVTAKGPTHIFGTTGADTTIRQATTDRNLAINGGNSSTDGAGVQLFGSTHGSFPGNGGLYSGATTVFAWNSTIVNLPLGTASRLLALDSSKNIVQTITSANLALSVSDETGSGSLVFGTSPSLTTPTIAGMTLSGTITGAVTATTAGTAGRFTNTTNTGSNVSLIIEHDRATPTANDVLIMDWRMSDSAGNQDIFGRVDLVASSVTNTSEASYFRMATMVAGSLTNILRFTNTAFRSETNDQMALGTATVSFADLFLASGGVINFNNGNVTLTHSTNLLSSNQAFLANGSGNVGSTAALRTIGSYGGGISMLDTAYVGMYAQTSGTQLVLYTDNTTARLTLGSTSTFGGALTVSGAFTSLGIDDNATGERVQIADTVLNLGTSGAAYGVTHSANDQSLIISGGNSTTDGANILLLGGTNGIPNVGGLYSATTRVMAWASTQLIFDRPAVLAQYTVATLPTGAKGMTAMVTDANATTFASIVAGGGANNIPVYYDGTNWRIG